MQCIVIFTEKYRKFAVWITFCEESLFVGEMKIEISDFYCETLGEFPTHMKYYFGGSVCSHSLNCPDEH
jgi:hypothetical protein